MTPQTKPLELVESRSADYSLLKIAKAFRPGKLSQRIGTCANIKNQVEPKYETSLGATTSAPYVLSRLCAMFSGLRIESQGQEAYKVTWETVIRHLKTGHVVTFYDYKGGISYGSDIYGELTPQEFIDDLTKLIDALKSDRFPHPYDGCVVGELA